MGASIRGYQPYACCVYCQNVFMASHVEQACSACGYWLWEFLDV